MVDIIPAKQDFEELRGQALAIGALVDNATITTDAEAEMLVDIIRTVIHPYKAEVERVLGSMKKKIFELHGEACGHFNDAMRPADAAEQKAGRLLAQYQADKKARLDFEAAQIRADAESRAMAEISAQIATGDIAGAEAAIAEVPATIAALVPDPVVKSQKGTTSTDRYTYEVVDVGKLREEFLMPRKPDRKAINRAVQRHKDMAVGVVGVGAIRVIKTPKVNFRRDRKKAEEGK